MVDPVGRAGGLVFMWIVEISINIIWSTNRIIHCLAMDIGGDSLGEIIACYGPSYLTEKRNF